jgi:hypothetical protein
MLRNRQALRALIALLNCVRRQVGVLSMVALLGLACSHRTDVTTYDFDRLEQVTRLQAPRAVVDGIFAHWKAFRGGTPLDGDATVLALGVFGESA